MANKKIVDETLKYEVIINGDKGKKEYLALEKATKKLLDRNDDLEKQAKKLRKSQKDNREELEKLEREIESNSKAVKENETRMKELTKEIGLNNLSMRQLQKEARKLSSAMANLDPNSEEWAQYNKQLVAVKSRLSELRKEMRPVQDNMEEQLGLVENLKSGFDQFFTSLRTGDYAGARAGLDSVKTGLKGAAQAAWALVTTPIGAFLAVLAGGIAAARFWIGYNESAREAIIITEQLTRLQGEQANATRLQAQAISENYGQDFQEVLRTAKNLVEEFDISFSEALDSIEEGLLRGQTRNQEYLDTLAEYDVFFSQAGFTADEFRRVIETGFDLGVYTDKLPDAIKEFDLSLREQTKSTREALQNAFGSVFTDDLLARITSGETTIKQALAEISAEAVENGLNIQQNAQLTADVFRGAGEDVGGAIRILEAYNIALNESERALTPLEERINSVAEANSKLAEEQDKALRGDNYLALANDIELFWIKVKTVFFQGIQFITDQFQKNNDRLLVFYGQTLVTLKLLPKVAKENFGKLKQEVFDVVRTFRGLGNVMERLLDWDFDGAREAFNDFKQDFREEAGDVANIATNAIDDISKARTAAGNLIRQQLEQRRQAAAEEVRLREAPPEVPIVGDNGNATGDSELTPEDKRKLESRKRLAQMLDAFEEERALQEQLKQIDKSKRAEEEEILRIQQEFAKLEEQAAGETDLLERLETEKLARIQEVRDKYADIRAENDREARERLNQQQREFIEAQIQAEERLNQAKESAAVTRIGILQRVFGESSAIGKALFVIQKGLAISNIVTETAKANALIAANLGIANLKAIAASPLTAGAPWVAANTASAAANVTANNSAAAINIGIIAAEGVAGLAGFEDGLYPVKRNDGRVFNARFGGEPTTQVVSAPTQFLAGEVRPEMIIDGDTFRQMDPMIINYIMSLAGKNPGFENGLYPKGPDNSAVMTMLVDVIARLNERLDAPFVTENYYGPEASKRQKQVDDQLKEIRNNAKLRRNVV